MPYPSTVGSFTNPLPTNKLNSPSHSSIETTQNTALTEVQTFVGTLSSVAGTIMYDVRAAASNGGGHVQTANKGGTGQTNYVKGDLLVATSASVLSKLTVGSDGQVPIADSSQSTGIKWGVPPASTLGLATYWVAPFLGGTQGGSIATADANFAAARYPVVQLDDAITSNAYFSFSVPATKTISSILVHWISGTTGDVRLTYNLWYATNNEVITNASNSSTLTVTATGANKINQTSIGSNLFTSVLGVDTIAFQVSRIGGDGTDTMNSRMGIIGSEVTFV